MDLLLAVILRMTSVVTTQAKPKLISSYKDHL